AQPLVGERDHLLQPLLVAAGIGAQAAAEVVVQHQRPAPEELFGEKVGQDAVARPVAGADAEQIGGVAVQHERRRGAGEIEVGQLRRPRGKPGGKIAGAAMRQLGRHARTIWRNSVSRIAGGSSSCSPSPVRCCSSLTAFSVCRMLSAAESTWLLRKSGSCRLTAISASAWIFPSMRSSSIATKSAFFLARPKLSRRSSPIAMLSWSERTTRSSLAACAVARFLRSSSRRAEISWPFIVY